MKSYETNRRKTQKNTKNHFKLSTSEPTCVSVHCWRATGTDKVTSTQVSLMQCIVGRTDIFLSLFLCFSHSYVSQSHNSTFCLATAIPQMQSGLQRTISAQHQVSMTTTLYLICIFCLHYPLMPNMVTLLFPPPLSASPPLFFLKLPLSLHFHNSVYSMCLMHMRTQTWTLACSLWVNRGSASDIRPVWRLRDKQWNRFWNQEVGCCKGCCSGTLKKKGNLQYVITILPRQVHHHRISLTPSVLRLRGWCGHKPSPLPPPKDRVHQTIAGMLDQVSGTHTHSNTQQHSAPVSGCQHGERETVNHTGQHSKGETAEESGRQTSILSAETLQTHYMMVKALKLSNIIDMNQY